MCGAPWFGSSQWEPLRCTLVVGQRLDLLTVDWTRRPSLLWIGPCSPGRSHALATTSRRLWRGNRTQLTRPASCTGYDLEAIMARRRPKRLGTPPHVAAKPNAPAPGAGTESGRLDLLSCPFSSHIQARRASSGAGTKSCRLELHTGVGRDAPGRIILAERSPGARKADRSGIL